MKKGIIYRLITLAVFVVVFNVLAFLIPFEHHTAFWLSYAFGMLALLAQWLIAQWSSAVGASARSKYYGFPIARIGWIYLAVQLSLGFLFMAVGRYAPTWIILILYITALCAAVVGLIAMDTVRDEIIRQDAKLVKDVSAMRAMQSEMTALTERCTDGRVLAAVRAFSEKLRYSDPVSSKSLKPAEETLAVCIGELQVAVDSGNADAAIALCTKASALLAERNRLCKVNKMHEH